MKNKETELLIEAYSKVVLLKEMSSEDQNPERSFSPPSYVPIGVPDRDFSKHPVTEPIDDPYKQLLIDSKWLKKHCSEFPEIAEQRVKEIAFNLEDLHNKLTRGY